MLVSPLQCLRAVSHHLETELSANALVVPQQPEIARSISPITLKDGIKTVCDEMLSELRILTG